MRCKNCPAYWENRDYEYGVQDWGCYCNPKAKDGAGREFANGGFGCNRKLPFIQKIMKKVQEEIEIEMKFRAIQDADFVKFMAEEEVLRKLATVICNDIGIGISAESILAYCTGAENKSMCPPYDADDFKRCHNLLSAFPEWKEKLKDIGKKHKQWGTVGEHWLEIEEAFVRKDYKSVCDMLDKYRHEEA